MEGPYWPEGICLPCSTTRLSWGFGVGNTRGSRHPPEGESGCRAEVAEVALRGSFLLQECPSGLVDEDTFKLIYAQFFPQGGESEANTPPPQSPTASLWLFCRRWASFLQGGDPYLHH